MTENELYAKVKTYAIDHGWLPFHLPQNRTVRPVKDAIGYPDLTLARDGQVIFMELKTEGGKLSQAQMRWRLELPAYYVIRPSDWEIGLVAELLS